VHARPRLRQVVNVVTLATPLGLLLAHAGGGARCQSAPDGSRGRRPAQDVPDTPEGLVVVTGYTWPLPPAPAFTVGNVIVLRRGHEHLAGNPRLMAHEARHATQWAVCGGLPFLPLYGLAAAWSRVRAGDAFSRNVFERRAGLADGGYRPRHR
jgi:hypothetical protein